MAIAFSRRLKQLILGNSSYTDGSLKDVMTGFTLRIFSGSRPATPEEATLSAVLLTITGCEFLEAEYDATVGNVLLKKESAIWTATAGAGGTASWFRCYVTGGDTGINADTNYAYARIDGDVSDTTGDLVMSDKFLSVLESKTIDQFNIVIT